MRGSRYHGKSAKKHKGKGTSGGKGMSGSGKRADQKKTYVLRYRWPYFGKKARIKEKKQRKKKGSKQINIGDIQKKYKPGEIDLSEYKVLGEGEIKDCFIIKARGFSKQAREKIEKAGGKIIVLKVRKRGEEEKKSEKKKDIKEKKTEEIKEVEEKEDMREDLEKEKKLLEKKKTE